MFVLITYLWIILIYCEKQKVNFKQILNQEPKDYCLVLILLCFYKVNGEYQFLISFIHKHYNYQITTIEQVFPFYNFRSKFMGASNCISQRTSLTDNFDTNEWMAISHYPNQVWEKKQTGCKATVHMLPKIAHIEKYQYRNLHRSYLPTVLHIIPPNYINCSIKESPYLLMVQFITLRLRDIDYLTYSEGLYSLKCALKGYQILGHFYGPLCATENLILINQYGNVKIWLNQDLTCNQPSEQAQIKLQKPSIKVSIYDRLRKSVRSIFDTIQSKCQKTFPFRTKINQIQSYTQVIAIINEHLQEQNINLPHSIDLQKHCPQKFYQFKNMNTNSIIKRISDMDIQYNKVKELDDISSNNRNVKAVNKISKQKSKNTTPTPDKSLLKKSKHSVKKALNGKHNQKKYINQTPKLLRPIQHIGDPTLNRYGSAKFEISPVKQLNSPKYQRTYNSTPSKKVKFFFRYPQQLSPISIQTKEKQIKLQGTSDSYLPQINYQPISQDNQNNTQQFYSFANPHFGSIYSQKIEQQKLVTEDVQPTHQAIQQQMKICMNESGSILRYSQQSVTINFSKISKSQKSLLSYSKTPSKKQKEDNYYNKFGRFTFTTNKNNLGSNVQDSVEFRNSLSLKYTESQKSEPIRNKQFINPQRKQSNNRYPQIESIIDIDQQNDLSIHGQNKKCISSKQEGSLQEKKQKVRQLLINSIHRSEMHRQQRQKCKKSKKLHDDNLFLSKSAKKQTTQHSTFQKGYISQHTHRQTQPKKQAQAKLKQTAQISQKLYQLVQSYHQKIKNKKKNFD